MRHFYLAIMIGVAGIGLSAKASAECRRQTVPIPIKGMFLKAQDLMEYEELSFRSYLIGYLEGIAVSPLMTPQDNCIEVLDRCFVGKNVIQLAAILRKFLKENPERWHEPAHSVAYSALIVPCR